MPQLLRSHHALRSVGTTATLLFSSALVQGFIYNVAQACPSRIPSFGVQGYMSRNMEASATSSTTSLSSSSQKMNTSTTTSLILGVRHGTSLANEYMTGPNEWGSPTFVDDPTLWDASLSAEGRRQAREIALQLLTHDDQEPIELIVVSPLTRCLQTLQEMLPEIRSPREDSRVPDSCRIVALSLCAERVYTSSDCGSPISKLQEQFSFVDEWVVVKEHHSAMDNDDRTTGKDAEEWWYSSKDMPVEEDEWRPNHGKQSYAVAGEPLNAFERRMERLREWLWQRSERRIMLVTHWGVLEALSGQDVPNGGTVRIMKHSLRGK